MVVDPASFVGGKPRLESPLVVPAVDGNPRPFNAKILAQHPLLRFPIAAAPPPCSISTGSTATLSSESPSLLALRLASRSRVA